MEEITTDNTPGLRHKNMTNSHRAFANYKATYKAGKKIQANC